MKERPIIFDPPNVAAILAGRKTQTRRVITPQPEVSEKGNLCGEWLRRPLDGLILPRVSDLVIHSPYGTAGDQLWVKEQWCWLADVRTKDPGGQALQYGAFYRADHPGDTLMHDDDPGESIRWRSSRFMPRRVARLNLDVISVRVERLHDISYDDAIAEGAADYAKYMANEQLNAIGETVEQTARRLRWPQRNYQLQWDQLNAKRGFGWQVNPWVWVVTFQNHVRSRTY